MIWIWNDYVVNSIILWIFSFQIVQIRHVLAWSVVQRLHFHVYHELTGNPSDLLVMKNEIIHKHHRFHIIHTRVQSDNDGVPRTGLQKRSEESCGWERDTSGFDVSQSDWVDWSWTVCSRRSYWWRRSARCLTALMSDEEWAQNNTPY